MELIAPNDDLVYRPMAVREPFAFGPPHRYPLRQIARDCDADWTQDSLSWVDPDAQVVHTESRRRVEYDALLVAVGARQVEPYEHAGTFHDADADAAYHGIVQDVEGGYFRSIAFIQPVGPVWPLPLYELALMTAERAESMDIRDLELMLVTPEARPLRSSGRLSAMSSRIASRERDQGLCQLTREGACRTASRHPAAGSRATPEPIITMPRIAGPSVRGLAGAGAHGFLPIDKHCSVPGAGGRVSPPATPPTTRSSTADSARRWPTPRLRRSPSSPGPRRPRPRSTP